MTEKSHDSAVQINQLPKIVPLQRPWWGSSLVETDVAMMRERGRHFLKIALPAIPVTVFSFTFLMVYIFDAQNDLLNNVSINPLPALFGAIMLTIMVCAVCVAIYIGYLQATKEDRS